MRHCYTIFCISALLLLAACGGSRYERMRQQLDSLQVLNQSDSLLTDDSLALDLTQYFDGHGSPNDRMQAHYLLARTYADRGEAPQALDEFHTAAECADTTSEECNYAQLCRVYSQMGYLLYCQNLLQEYLNSLDKAVRYGLLGSDTLAAFTLEALKMDVFDRLGIADSVIAVYERIYPALCSIGHEEVAATFSAVPVISYLSLQDTINARRCIYIYQQKSGYFDCEGNIDKGREYFYYIKGQYLLYIHQLDSAEHYFRKELHEGIDFINQHSASKGLAQLFVITNLSDSAARYALYSYRMNDSVYAQMATDEVAKVQGLYNYTVHQKRAMQAKERADRATRAAYLLLFALVLSAVIVFFVAWWWRAKRGTEHNEYERKVDELERAQSDILHLKAHEQEYESLIKEKEAIVNRQKSAIEAYQQKEKKKNADAESLLSESEMYKALHNKACRGELISDDEWHSLHKLVIKSLPEFYQLMSSNAYRLNDKEYKMCFLLRLHISPKSTSQMLGVSDAHVSQASKKIAFQFFEIKGASKELAKKLSEFC